MLVVTLQEFLKVKEDRPFGFNIAKFRHQSLAVMVYMKSIRIHQRFQYVITGSALLDSAASLIYGSRNFVI